MSQIGMPLCNAKNRCYHWSSSRAPEPQCCLAVAAEHTGCMLIPVRHLSSRHSLLRIDPCFCIAGRVMIWGALLLEEQDHFWRKWSIRCAICNHLCVFKWLNYMYFLYSKIIHIHIYMHIEYYLCLNVFVYVKMRCTVIKYEWQRAPALETMCKKTNNMVAFWFTGRSNHRKFVLIPRRNVGHCFLIHGVCQSNHQFYWNIHPF